MLLRNGASLATLPGTTTTYTDQSAEPDHPYEYAVRLGGSESSSAEVTATIRTPKAPRLSKARIAGTIDVKRTYVTENYTNRAVGDVERDRWIFRPRCDTGPCAVRVDLLINGQSSFITLTYRSGTYRGTATKNSLTRCGSTKEHVQSTVAITLHTTKARFVVGQWQAVRVQGTYVVHDASTAQCAPGFATTTISGKVPGT